MIPYVTSEKNLVLVKQKKGKYDLITEASQPVLVDVTSNMVSDEEALLTRIISTALRHGTDITFLVEQLNKSNGDITSFGKAVSRVLKKYVNEEKMVSRATCTECGGTNLVFEEGCLSCKDCGSSKCG